MMHQVKLSGKYNLFLEKTETYLVVQQLHSITKNGMLSIRENILPTQSKTKSATKARNQTKKNDNQADWTYQRDVPRLFSSVDRIH